MADGFDYIEQQWADMREEQRYQEYLDMVNKTNELNYQLAKEQMQFQKNESEEAYKREIEMWNMQNAYNSPATQMKRYVDAGLNPLLIYSQGNNGNSSSMPKYSPASYNRANFQSPKFATPTNYDMQNRQILANVDASKASEQLAYAQMNKVYSETKSQDINNSTLYVKNLLQLKYQELENLHKMGAISQQEQQTKYLQFQNKLFNETFKEQVASYKADLDNKKASTANMNANTKLQAQQTVSQELQNKFEKETYNLSFQQKEELVFQAQQLSNKYMNEAEKEAKALEILEETLGKEKAQRLLAEMESEQFKDAYGPYYNKYKAQEALKIIQLIFSGVDTAANAVGTISELKGGF